jgi:serine/threonine protein kinase
MISVGLIIVIAVGGLILILCSSLLFTRFKEWFLRDRTNGAGKSASLAGNLVREVQGKLSDNYRLSKHCLGKGVSAECFLGTHVESKRDYAVKIIDTCDEKILKYYEKEIQLLRSLEHTNIVRLYEVYRGTNTINLVMELCLGGHLGEVIHSQQEGRLDETVAQGYIAQLVGAVAHCHGRGICHRDIKLQNILLDTKGRDGQIKLIDFGHAKRFEIDHENPVVFTKMAGTTYTMAPEVSRNL